MHMYGATVHECTNTLTDTQKQLSSLAWPCELVELCDVNVLWHSLQACKIKQGLPQEEPNLSCDFHCFIYAKTWRAASWDTLTYFCNSTQARTFSQSCRIENAEFALCIGAFPIPNSVSWFLHKAVYYLDMCSAFRLSFIFFSLFVLLCVFSDDLSLYHPPFSIQPSVISLYLLCILLLHSVHTYT